MQMTSRPGAPEQAQTVVILINTFLRQVPVPLLTDGSEDWQHSVAVERRKGLPYIGMRNPGARCYMNAMVHQLFAVTPFREAVNSAAPDEPGDEMLTGAAAEEEGWACDTCTMRNPWDVEKCEVCGTGARPEKPKEEKVPKGEVLRQLQRTL
eukprot:989365-Rhodomonas_salina.1